MLGEVHLSTLVVRLCFAFGFTNPLVLFSVIPRNGVPSYSIASFLLKAQKQKIFSFVLSRIARSSQQNWERK